MSGSHFVWAKHILMPLKIMHNQVRVMLYSYKTDPSQGEITLLDMSFVCYNQFGVNIIQ